MEQIKIEKEVDYDPFPDTSWLEQEGFEEELDRYQRGLFLLVYVKARAELYIPYGDGWVVEDITSPGLHGIAVEDFDDPYLDEVFLEEKEILKEMLQGIQKMDIKKIA
ncbi:MAG: hypothetical protein GF388_02470 [Candidatus Aegiribacteria sp.]|nr:hypothetical protein [Candidatus Aegiribacteria sp.]